MRAAINVPELMSIIKEVLLRFSGLTTFWKQLEFRIRPNLNQTMTIRISVSQHLYLPNQIVFLKITNERILDMVK